MIVITIIFCLNRFLDRNYRATYLPEVAPEHFGNKKLTVESLIKKAGYNGKYENVLESIKCERYQSCKTKLTFDEYLAMKGITK